MREDKVHHIFHSFWVPENETSEFHDPKFVQDASQGENDLAEHDQSGEYDRPQLHSKDSGKKTQVLELRDWASLVGLQLFTDPVKTLL